MIIDYPECRAEIIHTAREMNRLGINQGTSGNVSVRHPQGEGLFITPTSLPYEQMQPADIVHLHLDGRYRGERRPTSEWRFHRDIIRERDDVNVVLHTHSVYATSLAIHHREIPAFHYMVAVAGGSTIRCADYATFGTQALSDNMLRALEGRSACLMAQHGLVVVAKTFDKALWLAIEVETLAKQYIHALAIGEPPVLCEEEMARVMAQMRRMSYGQAPDVGEGGEGGSESPALA